MFYLAASFLALLAALFAAWPLFSRRNRDSSAADSAREKTRERNAIVRALYRNRLQELATETVDDTLREEMETELGAVLLTETDAIEPAGGPDPAAVADSGRSRLVWVVSCWCHCVALACTS